MLDSEFEFRPNNTIMLKILKTNIFLLNNLSFQGSNMAKFSKHIFLLNNFLFQGSNIAKFSKHYLNDK